MSSFTAQGGGWSLNQMPGLSTAKPCPAAGTEPVASGASRVIALQSAGGREGQVHWGHPTPDKKTSYLRVLRSGASPLMEAHSKQAGSHRAA